MPYRKSQLATPHYIQVIRDEMNVIMNEALKDDTTYERTEELHKRTKELAYKKRQILDAMRKHYDRRTFAQLFFEWYYEEDE